MFGHFDTLSFGLAIRPQNADYAILPRRIERDVLVIRIQRAQDEPPLDFDKFLDRVFPL